MKNQIDIFTKLEICGFNVSTDTRKDIKGTVFFAIKGENFDGNKFVKEALSKGATAVVTQNKSYKGKNIFVVKDTLKTLQEIATIYRETFNIPIIAIGGSNGKTTSKELISSVLGKEYKGHSTSGSFNNHLGVPLSILSMKKDTEIGVFEIGANHGGEHTDLLNILKPTHVVVTNNGMDHLEGFGSPLGARKANKEIYDWANKNKREVFVNKELKDLITDSNKNNRIFYPNETIKITSSTPLHISYKNKIYKTKMSGVYNLPNIYLAVSVGNYFGLKTEKILKTICNYRPSGKRSQILKQGKNTFIVDCYNANPTSMMLSLETLAKNVGKKIVILGDMLELGKYSQKEHKKIYTHIKKMHLDKIILIGNMFRKAIDKKDTGTKWFPDSLTAKEWFNSAKFTGYTILLKGSRGMKIEKIIEV